MSAVWSLTGEKRTWQGKLISVAIDPIRTFKAGVETARREDWRWPPNERLDDSVSLRSTGYHLLAQSSEADICP